MERDAPIGPPRSYPQNGRPRREEHNSMSHRGEQRHGPHHHRHHRQPYPPPGHHDRPFSNNHGYSMPFQGHHGDPHTQPYHQPPIYYQPGQTIPRPPQFANQGAPPQHHNPLSHRHHQPPQSFGPNQFPVQPLDRFKVKCAPFRQPIEIGSFSYDEQRNFVMDDSQLKYYFPPDLSKPNNLSVNYDKYISRDLMVDEHIDALLDALMCIKDREDEEERINSKQQQSDVEPSSQDPGGANSGSKLPPRHQNRASTTRADFVCYRGILTKIMCTPYTRNEPWELGATLYKGSIYIEEHVTDEKRQSAGGSNERHKLMSYWGYRFETICNISKPVSELQRIKTRKRRATDVSSLIPSKAQATEVLDERRKAVEDGARPHEPGVLVEVPETGSKDLVDVEERDSDDQFEQVDQVDPSDPELLARYDGIVNTNLQYCTVARTKIGQNSIIMGAEVDCTSEPKKGPPHNSLSNYIELKTSRVISSPREQSSFEKYKLLKFWAQSFLPGIPTIIVGFRDDDGNVVHVQTFKTMEIPRLVRGKEGAWDTTICINFLDGVLSFLKRLVVKDDPSLTYSIRWAYPFQAIEVEFAGPKDSFLTKRFLDRWERNIDPSN